MCERDPSSAFEAVCALAAEKRWCWKIGCTTCGCMYFRFAFMELADGRHPLDRRWRLRRPGRTMHDLHDPQAQQRLAARLADARLTEIRSSAPHPDWLGYLGLGLFFTADAGREGEALADAWLAQLNAMVEPGTEPLAPGSRLRWQDLGKFKCPLA